MLSRAARLTNALRDRRRTLAVAGAAAALAGTGAGTAMALASPGHPAALADRPSATSAARQAIFGSASASMTAAHAASRHATANPAGLPRRATANVRLAAHTQRAAPAKPYLIYDSTTPEAIPAHHEVATYADGNFAVPGSQVAGRNVMWIDTNGSDTHANALDIEPGDATPSQAATWVSQKLTADPHTTAVLYTMKSDWPAVQASVATLPAWMQHQVRWWIADPTGVPHVVPGSNATQWYWGQSYDISTATPGF
jgi:hypothetical protein